MNADSTPNGPALVLRFDTETAAALYPMTDRTDERWTEWLDESLTAVASIRQLLDDFDAPASFFMVGQLLERAGNSYEQLLGNTPRFDIGNHTLNHTNIRALDALELTEEVVRTTDLITKCFGHKPIGITAPGCFDGGLRGYPDQLKTLWECGYRHITTQGQASKKETRHTPPPFVQPYWYHEYGFPLMLEVPLTGWHCNILFNSGGQVKNWEAVKGLPDGTIVRELPRSIEEGYSIRKRELEYAIEHNLVYSPCMHPWSVHRADPEMNHIRWLIEYAVERGVPLMNCRDVYLNYGGKA